jgi:hypothetical protein
MKLLGIISVGFDIIDQTMIRIFTFVRYWRKKWQYNETVYQLFIDFKKAHDSFRREVLYSILIELVLSMEQTRLTEICLNETYGKIRIGKHLSDNFRIQNDLKQGDVLSPLLFNFE